MKEKCIVCFSIYLSFRNSCKDNTNGAQNCCTSFYGKPKIEAICNFLGVVGRLMGGRWGEDGAKIWRMGLLLCFFWEKVGDLGINSVSLYV